MTVAKGVSSTPEMYPPRAPGDFLCPLPIRMQPEPGEALDSYLERLAAANHLDASALLRRVADGGLAYLPLAPTSATLHRLAAISGQSVAVLEQATITAWAGIADSADHDRGGWRRLGRAWAPGRGTQLCPACLAADGSWRLGWRHPWVTVCLIHRIWLHTTCPSCGLPFRSQRHTALRSVDAQPGTCGNPAGARGRTCDQGLFALECVAAPTDVLKCQRRIDNAVHHRSVVVVGTELSGQDYLVEVKALTVLLLHLVCQPRGDLLAPWAQAARDDKRRSAFGRGARWALAPPADGALRGQALATADQILGASGIDEAADRLGSWLDLSPRVPEGQLGWLADHTTMTPLLTRLVMTGTSTRRRISTLLGAQSPLAPRHIPQVLPGDLYTQHLADKLDVANRTGRHFASLCAARLGRPGTRWTDAAGALGLPAELGTKTARACSAAVLCTPAAFIAAVAVAAVDLSAARVDYRQREETVGRLAVRKRWYRNWARTHRPGSRATSKPYAIAWLWTTYAAGHLATSPGWPSSPTTAQRDHYRRYVRRLTGDARIALLALAVVDQQEAGGTRR